MILDGGPLRPPPDNLTFPQFLLDVHHPDRPIRITGQPWLVDDPTGKSYGFEEVRARVQGLANTLSSKYGLQEGETVCLFSPNHIDYAIAIWAVHRLGGVVTTANPGYSSDELVYQLTIAPSVLIIAHPDTKAAASEAARKVGISQERIVYFSSNPLTGPEPSMRTNAFVDDLINEGNERPLSFTERRLQPGEAKTKLAVLAFSSGTTGRPKAVAIAHYAMLAAMLQTGAFNRIADPTYDVSWDQRRFRPGDVAIAVLPLYHIYGLILNLSSMLFAGITVVVTPKFIFEELLKSIVRYKITHLYLVPPQVILFSKHPAVKKYDLSSVRLAGVGAAPTSAELTLQFQKIFPDAQIGQGYGLTETCAIGAMFPLSQRIGTPGSVGRIGPGMLGKIVKEDGTLAGYNEPGELILKGPQMALGYLDNEEATRETFVDGWVRTGDEVIVKEDGDIFIVDRRKEILKVGGFQVAPAELEGHLLDFPDVAGAGIVGVPDEFNGEVPLAFIALNASAASRVKQDPQEGQRIKAAIIKHVADAKVRYKWLAGGVEFIDAIPVSPSGKIMRRFLRDTAKGLIEQRKHTRTPSKSRPLTSRL